MKKILGIIAAAMLLTSHLVIAAEGIFVGPTLTGYAMGSDRFIDGADEGLIGGISFGYRFFNDWSLELNAGRDIAGHEMDVAQANFYYYFGQEDGSWRPYALAGISYYDQEDSLSELQADQEETHQAQFGVGLAKMFSDQWEFRSDVRLYHKVREGQDGINDGAINFAINYYFEAPTVVAVAEPAPRVAEPFRHPEPVRQSEPVRTLTIRLNVEFEFDQAIVRAIYGDELQAIANAMRENDDIVLVLEGHTDAQGSEQYNQNLSERRASAVKAKLIQDYSLPADRVSSIGYGESRPIADNDTDEGRAKNRRVIGEMSYTEVVD